ncbi:UNVERIFIED_CONTAM: Tabersonine-19-hydroxy-O-acetyltransferase [Sesamum calycinum]|uniref:Tabersonine-19-hydroxy-O-acetyltransferase n=1 Tax=Sesamum calycinum TaxID=2727403 RepID=A0AAW2KCX2_9LAMI
MAFSANDTGKNLGYLVTKIRDAVRKIDEDLVNRLLGDEGFLGYRENLQRTSEIFENADLLSISSWCGFSWYSADFGWGKPMWLTKCNVGSDSETRFLRDVLLLDTRNGDGIQAWVILEEKYMSVFDNVEELRELASCDPSPLDIVAAIRNIFIALFSLISCFLGPSPLHDLCEGDEEIAGGTACCATYRAMALDAACAEAFSIIYRRASGVSWTIGEGELAPGPPALHVFRGFRPSWGRMIVELHLGGRVRRYLQDLQCSHFALAI